MGKRRPPRETAAVGLQAAAKATRVENVVENPPGSNIFEGDCYGHPKDGKQDFMGRFRIHLNAEGQIIKWERIDS
jgi:hypothetical protein